MLYPLSYEGGAGRKPGRELPAAAWGGTCGEDTAHSGSDRWLVGCRSLLERAASASEGGRWPAGQAARSWVVRAWCSSRVSELTMRA
jgi:hypothetical protein